ncbi:MAG: response regulator [bacterium]|nr:response regulator [bacterium]
MLADATQPDEPLRGFRILVVDDEEDIRTFLLAVFADAGAQICEASDGQEAIEVARSHAPDLITLDLSMPGRDGIQAFCELRATPGLEEIPICIVTGHPEMRSLIYDRPATPPEGFLSKPVEPKELLSTVRRILRLRQRKQDATRS